MNTRFSRRPYLSAALVLTFLSLALSSSSIFAKNKPIPSAMGHWNFDWRGNGDPNGGVTVILAGVVNSNGDGYFGDVNGDGLTNTNGTYTVSGPWYQVGKQVYGDFNITGDLTLVTGNFNGKISSSGDSMTLTITFPGQKLKLKLDTHTP